MVNFNPEPTSGPATGLIAAGFVISGCQFRSTGAIVPLQIEPLGAGTTVRNANIHGNIFENLYLSMRGAISNAVVSGNVFDGGLGGVEIIRSYAANGGTPAGITVTNNILNNPATTGPNVAVIRVETAPAVVMGNSVIGTGWSGYAYGTGTAAAIFLGNVGLPHTTPNATGGSGPPTWTA
jgi:hypothetical protein